MNTTKKIILVPVDFSEQSLVALHHAEVVTRAMGGELHMLHVMDEPGVLSSLFSDKDLDAATEKVWTKMNELTSKQNASGLQTHALVGKGKIYEEVVRVAELIGASFIIMGTNGADGLKKRFIGSNALRVVRESRIPVISIKGSPKHDGFKNIVLPLDLTKETREKVNKAIELSRQFGATVHVVSILLTNDEEVVSRLRLQLGQVEHFMSNANVKFTSELIQAPKNAGDLSEEVMKYAQSVNGDLIMIMTQQETDVTELFIGSAAQEIINSSEIPVCSIIPSVKKNTTVFTPY
jgi:nucleotide-binding universal stress UspA family protein